MSVYTTVTPEDFSAWLKNYSIGVMSGMQGILSGIENTNYFVSTTHGKFVLTLFEKLQPAELPFYLNLMAHLSMHGIPCPKPLANLQNELLGELNGKPATLVTFLEGQPVLAPGVEHCASVGEVLAEMHLAGQSYRGHLDNPRGPRWWTAVAPEIYPFLNEADAALLKSEIQFQGSHRYDQLPRGVIHADLFRDNVLFMDAGSNGARVGGLIDFYFACVDVLIYDVAITVNDWCTNADCSLDPERTTALLSAYKNVRPFTEDERDAWPVMLRAGALRFWVSRLYDFHLPRDGELTHKHDPEQFRCVLVRHIADAARAVRLAV